MASTTERIIAADPRASAIVDLLTKAHPRIDCVEPGVAIVAEGRELVEGAVEAIGAMRDTVLAIQGPPGTGKTYVSAKAIVALVRTGRRVAVSSNSHRAIGNLLKGVAEEGGDQGGECRIAQKVSDPSDAGDHPAVQVVSANEAPEIAAADVVGATSWHFARYDDAAFDHLVIDEAGQVSLANVMAMSRVARNIVLVGDPMQLPQPIQGAHPGESGLSSLEYLIGEHRTVPADRGIFLPTTRRLHDDLCAFISRAVYEGRLENDAAASAQSLVAPDGTDLAGARVVGACHEGRSQVGPEEVERVHAEIESVLGARFVDRDGEQHGEEQARPIMQRLVRHVPPLQRRESLSNDDARAASGATSVSLYGSSNKMP